jgi:hypothetical protein
MCLGELITQFLNINSQDQILRVELGHINVIYDVPNPSLLLHIADQLTRNDFLILIKEIKSDIIYFHMDLLPRQVTNLQQCIAHPDFTSRTLLLFLRHKTEQIRQSNFYHSNSTGNESRINLTATRNHTISPGIEPGCIVYPSHKNNV